MLRTCLAITLMSVLVVARAQGETLLVPQEFPTIQAALDAAAAGDEVRIEGGVYAESVTASLPANVTIRAKGNVRIDATGLGPALTVDGQDLQVIGLRVIGGTDGIVISGTDALVRGCRVKDVTGRGFVVSGSHTTLEKCRVRDSGGDGIALVGGTVAVVRHCRVADPQGSGFSIAAAAAAAFVFHVRIHRAGVDGLVNNGGGSSLNHVRVAKPAGHGIVDAAPLAAVGNSYIFCRAVKPVGDGILSTGRGPTLASCRFSRPGGTGIDVAGDQASVKHCHVKAAGEDGLHIGGDQGEWITNRCFGAAGNGYVLDGTGNTLSLNVGKGSDGFDLLDNQPGLNTIEDDNTFGTVGP